MDAAKVGRVLAGFGFALLGVTAGCAHSQTDKPLSAANAEGSASASRASSSSLREVPKKTDGSDEDNAPLDAKCGAVSVHFELDSAEINESAKNSLVRTARCLRDNQRLFVRIEGNADERGTEEYNLALGDRRAQAVVRYLKMMGAGEPQLKTVSFGKSNPLCNDHDESCWQQNRRAETKIAPSKG